MADTSTGGSVQPAASQIQGNLVFDNGLPAAGITTRVYDVGFAGRDTKLGETQSDVSGNYAITYQNTAASLPNLQVRVLDFKNNEVTISNTKFNAQALETLNLTVPATVQLLMSEYQRLSDDMAKTIGGVANLAQAQENSTRRDFTLLNHSTNWDARLIAVAATAAQQTAATGLGQDVLYALFRVGLPTDPSLLAMVPSGTVQTALTKASQAGIVSRIPRKSAPPRRHSGNMQTRRVSPLPLPAPRRVSAICCRRN
jgi:hypothetical protein